MIKVLPRSRQKTFLLCQGTSSSCLEHFADVQQMVEQPMRNGNDREYEARAGGLAEFIGLQA